MLEWRLFDQYAHREMPPTLNGAAVDSQGNYYLYFTRLLAHEWPETHTSIIHTMVRRAPKKLLWQEISHTDAFAKGMSQVVLGERQRAGRRIITGVEGATLQEDGLVVIEEPAKGWRWRRLELDDETLTILQNNAGGQLIH